MSIYKTNQARSTKIKAYKEAIAQIDNALGLFALNFKFKCVLLMPSMDCLDIQEFKTFIDNNTRIIVVENFSYIKDTTKREFKENFQQKLINAGLEKCNVHYHFGNLEELQLFPTLKMLGVEKVDFMFLDFCDSTFSENTCNFLWMNRDFIATNNENGFLLVTKTIQPRNKMYENVEELIARFKHNRGFDRTQIKMIKGKISNNLNNNLRNLVSFRAFQVSHLLNCNGYYESLEQFKPIIYNGGVSESTKMGLFITQNIDEEKDDNRHECYLSYITHENTSEPSPVIVDLKHNRKCGDKFTEADKAIFSIDRFTDEGIDKGELFYHIFDPDHKTKDVHNRRFKPDRIYMKMQSIFKNQYPKEGHLLSHKGCRLDYGLMRELFEKYFLNQEIVWRGLRLECRYLDPPHKGAAPSIGIFHLRPFDHKEELVTPDNINRIYQKGQAYLKIGSSI